MDYDRPCINCRAFHWGPCRFEVRTCWTCGALGHIQRYCHQQRRPIAPRGESLPGTSSWCEALGLDDDPLLKSNIVSTLKHYPGATIYLNDECIYRGVQTYFYRKALLQGRDLAERLRHPAQAARRRSRSPSKERVLKRSRSPLGRYSRGNSPWILEEGQVSERRLLSPMIDPSDCEMVSPPWSSHMENIEPAQLPLRQLIRQSLPPVPAVSASKLGPTSRPALAIRSGNVTLPSVLDYSLEKVVAPPAALENMIHMEDPHFVLGISKGAREAEVITSYQQRMWEIELERTAEGHYEPSNKAGMNRWDESIRILKAARAQLLGP